MDQLPYDLIISAAEINNHHGVGVLLHRFFPDSTGLVTLRSRTLYEGRESFGRGHHELRSRNLSLDETEAKLKEILAAYRIRRILCVPYYREDFIHGLLARKLTKAPLCTYLMDDQNIFAREVPDYWVADLLQASDLCLGISPELCVTYEHKFGRKFHLLPPLIERAEPIVPCYWEADSRARLKIAMVGNVWTADRFQRLRALLREAAVHVDWYGNGSAANWLPGTPEEWEADHIRCLGYLPEEDLIASLAAYPCVLVPSGSLDQDDDALSFSRLSLPSRLIFLHTRTDTPVLLLGSKESAAGRFILRLGTGLCAAYEVQDLRRQLARLHDPVEHHKLRQAIRHWAPNFVLTEGGQWLWTSLANKAPLPATFHSAFQMKSDDATWLKNVPLAKPKPVRRIPKVKDPISDEAMKAFAFLRTGHLRLLEAKARTAAGKDPELTQLLERMVEYLLLKKLPNGGDVLILGTSPPPWAGRLPANVTAWRPHNIDEWLQAGFPANSSNLVSVAGGVPYDRPHAEFDAVISSSWLDQVKTPEMLGSLSACLTRHTRPGGFNLHALTAVLHPDYFWTAPAHAHLRSHWKLGDWPDLDEILTAQDLFAMSEAAYDEFWHPSMGKSYRDFGRPLGLFLFWRKDPLAPSIPTKPRP